MTTILLIVHLIVTLVLIAVVLIQRSEGGGLGIGSSQGMGGFMGGRGTANLLTRTTAVLGTIFFVLALTLALMSRGTTGIGSSLLDRPPAASTPAVPAAAPGTTPPGTATGTPPAATPGATPATTPPAAPAPTPKVPTN